MPDRRTERSLSRVRKPEPVPVRRAAQIKQVKEYLPASASDPRPPVLAFTGISGSGKTTLLGQLDGELRDNTPRALIDCAEYAPDDIPGLLTEIKFQLGRPCPGLGRLQFRRLELGLAVSKKKIDFTDQGEALREIRELIRTFIFRLPRRLADVIGGMAGDLFALLTQLPVSLLRALVEHLSVAVITRVLSSPPFIRRAQDWYGHRDQGLPHDGVFEVAALNRWAQDPDKHLLRDKRLIEAFLADLRDAFSRGRRARPGWYNCVVLLDNADTGPGPVVLRLLDELRADLERSGLPAEPLLVVATSSEPFTGGSIRRKPLPEFSGPDTAYLCSKLTEVADPRLWRLIHLCTGGYPAASELLVRTACDHLSAAEGGISALLAAKSDPHELDVEHRLREQLVRTLVKPTSRCPTPEDALETLSTCAAARTRADAEWLTEKYSDGVLVDAELLWRAGLWDKEGRTAAHDLLRRLLLRRLAERKSGDQPNWTDVHRALRHRRRERGDIVGELYHSLADGGLEDVAQRLTGLLPERSWLARLHSVTSAPRKIPGTSASTPYDHQIDLTRTMSGHHPPHLLNVARVVSGLWIANDPCADPDRAALHEQIDRDFRTIAPHSDQPQALRDEAQWHFQLAESWKL